MLKPSDKNDSSFNVDIYSYKVLKKNEELSILWKQVSNVENYLYYGFVDENNMITPTFYVDLINKNFKADLNIDFVNKKNNINFEDLIQPKSYELNTDFYHNQLVHIYKNLSLYFDKYYHKHEGPYMMMKDNLHYYLNLYNELYNDELINRNIEGINKKKYVKNILGMERKLIEKSLNILNKKIKHIMENKEEQDIYELLKRTQAAKRKKSKKNYEDE